MTLEKSDFAENNVILHPEFTLNNNRTMMRHLLLVMAAMLLTCCSKEGDVKAQETQTTANGKKVLVIVLSTKNPFHHVQIGGFSIGT